MSQIPMIAPLVHSTQVGRQVGSWVGWVGMQVGRSFSVRSDQMSQKRQKVELDGMSILVKSDQMVIVIICLQETGAGGESTKLLSAPSFTAEHSSVTQDSVIVVSLFLVLFCFVLCLCFFPLSQLVNFFDKSPE